MTNTLVKEAGSGAQFFQGVRGIGTQKLSGTGDAFQDVLNRESEQNTTKPKQDESVTQAVGTGKTRELSGNRDYRKERVKSVAPEENANELTELENPDGVSQMDEAVIQIFQMITETFPVDADELQHMMDELGLDMRDLLDTEKLGTLLLQAAGESNSFALVTNEELYTAFRQVMDFRNCLEEKLPTEEVNPEEPETALTKETGKDGISPTPITDTVQKSDPAKYVSQGKEETGNQERHSEKSDPVSTKQGDNPIPVYVEENGTTRLQAYLASASETGDVFEPDTQNIMRQILDYMRVSLKPEENQLVMQLHPASLGSLQVQLASKGGMVTAQFIAENELVKVAIESQMTALKEQFEQQGVRVEAIEVSVQTHMFERNMGQDREQAGQSQGRRDRTRRIRTGAGLSVEEGPDEEGQTPELPGNNGSRVDYMA